MWDHIGKSETPTGLLCRGGMAEYPGRSGEKRPNVNVKIRSNRLRISDGGAWVEWNLVCQVGFLLGYWVLFCEGIDVARAEMKANGRLKWEAKNRVRAALSAENPPQIPSTRLVQM